MLGQKPLNIAHRGGMGLAPENTIVAMHTALEAGADILDIDIRITKDGHVVVIHDENVDNTTDGKGRVSQLTLRDLKCLDAGYWFSNGECYPYRNKGISIPTLDETFLEFPRTRFNIHIASNTYSIIEPLVRLLHKRRMTDLVTIASFHWKVITKIRSLYPYINTAATWPEILLAKLGFPRIFRQEYRKKIGVLQVPFLLDWRENGRCRIPIRFVSNTFINRAHEKGCKVYVWTVDEEPTMELLIKWGVDGIITNRPDLLSRLLAKV